MTKNSKLLIDVLHNKKTGRIPFWFMRQAGRYLPEYLELRREAGSFLNLVYDSEKASEVTMQPLRRFGMDAAILFSDILIVPHALGQNVRFEAGEGPRLDEITTEQDILNLDISKVETHALRVFETVFKTAQKMKLEGFDKTALIGFCGSPWTVICYMIEGRGSKDFAKARHWALSKPKSFQNLVDVVVEASCIYLSGQIRAGAEAIQLFESWAGVLDSDEFYQWVIEPNKKIRSYLKLNHPNVPVVGFPRGAGVLTKDFAIQTGVDCVAIDQMIPPSWAFKHLQPLTAVQGNLDPVRLLCGGESMELATKNITNVLGKKPFIFNLGHGIIKETPIANVQRLCDLLKSG